VLLPGADDDGPARALVRACERERLDFAFVPSWEPWALEAADLLGRCGVAVAWVVPGVLWPTLEVAGIPEGLRLVATDAEASARLMDDAVACAVPAAQAGIAAGAAALVVADDLAGSEGPLVDPTFLRSAVFARLTLIAGLAASAGIPAILHSDGDVRALMPDALAAGFAALHGDAGGGAGIPEALAAARAAGLVFVGGIPTAALASAEEAVSAGECVCESALEGGMIVADDGGLTTRQQVTSLLQALRSVRAGG
jgi:uroporphyrinogen decarboxylase